MLTPNLRSVFPPVAVVLLWFGSCCPARAVQDPLSGRLPVELPGALTERFFVLDMAQHLESLLASPAGAELLNGRLAAFLRGNPDFRDFGPAQAKEWLKANRHWFPHTIALAMEPEAYDQAGQMLEEIVAFSLASASALEPDNVEAELGRLHGEMAELATRMRLPEIRIVANWKDERVSMLLMGLLTGVAVEPLENLGFDVDSDQNRLQAGGELGDIVDAQMLRPLFDPLGLTGDSAALDRTVTVLEKMPLHFQIARHGTALELVIGRGGRAGAAAGPSRLAGDVGDGTVAWFRFDTRRLEESAARLEALTARWQDSGLHKALQTIDDEDSWGDMRRLPLQLRQGIAAGEIVVRALPAELRVRMHEVSPGRPSPGNPEVLCRYLPADAEAWLVSSATDFMQLIAAQLEDVEGRMATKKLQAALGDDPGKLTAYERVSSGYYNHFTRFRTFVLNDLRATPGSPYAMILETGHPVSSIQVRLDRNAGPVISLKNVELPEFAAIISTDDPAGLRTKMATAWQLLAEGFFSLRADPLPVPGNLVEVRDLGLGRESWALDLGWPARVFDGEVEISGEFAPHMLEHEGVLIVSTSPRLSRRLLQAAQDGAMPWEPVAGRRVVARAQATGGTIGRAFSGVWRPLMLPLVGSGSDRDGQLIEVVEGLADLIKMSGRLEMETIDDGEGLDTTFRLLVGPEAAPLR